MNRIAQSIKNRLSLRPPQADSLNVLAELADKLTLKKQTTCHAPEENKMGISQEGKEHTPNPLSREEYKSPLSEGDSGVSSFLQQELEKVKTSFPTCTDFERYFPSICFSLASGVGKTRLMGAFVVYLYLTKGIKNFFILAPNITIYNKLIEDFSNSTSPKYVFQGIGEFVHRQPRIITGDTYNTIARDNKVKPVKPFTRIEEHNLSKYTKDGIHHYNAVMVSMSFETLVRSCEDQSG